MCPPRKARRLDWSLDAFFVLQVAASSATEPVWHRQIVGIGLAGYGT
jgi:hypothetical protein